MNRHKGWHRRKPRRCYGPMWFVSGRTDGELPYLPKLRAVLGKAIVRREKNRRRRAREAERRFRDSLCSRLLTGAGELPCTPTYGMPIQLLRPSPNQEWPSRTAWLKAAVEKEFGTKVLDARFERDNRIVVVTDGDTIEVTVRLTCDDD